MRDGACWHWARWSALPGLDLTPAEARIRNPADSLPRTVLVFAHGIGMQTKMRGEQRTIPDGNVLRCNQGHFTVSLGLTAAPEPLRARAENDRGRVGSTPLRY